MRNDLLIAVCLLIPLSVFSQVLRDNRQQKFPDAVPAGNYSGITPIGNDRYAVVCDKSADGFYVFHIDIDTVSGRIVTVRNEGFRPSGHPNRDQEGIAFRSSSRTLYICGESDNRILEYSLDGRRTGRSLQPLPAAFSLLDRNAGLESLCYDDVRHRFYTVSERPAPGDSLLRLTVLDDDGTLLRQHGYRLDTVRPRRKGVQVNGVSELCCLGDGRLLVLERTVRVPKLKIGSYVDCRLYEVCPDSAVNGRTTTPEGVLPKQLLCRFRTRLNLLRQNFANYEGVCVARELSDGRKILLLMADSQNQYQGVLRDWFRTLIIR